MTDEPDPDGEEDACYEWEEHNVGSAGLNPTAAFGVTVFSLQK